MYVVAAYGLTVLILTRPGALKPVDQGNGRMCEHEQAGLSSPTSFCIVPEVVPELVCLHVYQGQIVLHSVALYLALLMLLDWLVACASAFSVFPRLLQLVELLSCCVSLARCLTISSLQDTWCWQFKTAFAADHKPGMCYGTCCVNRYCHDRCQWTQHLGLRRW